MMLEVCDVHKSYPKAGSLFGSARRPVLCGVRFSVAEGASVGLIGESGSGKSTLGRLVLGLETPDSGAVLLEGLPPARWRHRHPGEMSVVFQDYTTSVNPGRTVEAIIREPLDVLVRLRREHDPCRRIPELMERVGLSPKLAGRYPHELSGGQLQRVCIARAIATRPRFIVFDEAISSLDVSVQAQILELLCSLKKNMTCLFIAHDLQAVTHICDDILFLHDGVIVERASGGALENVRHEYARTLLDAVFLFQSRWNEKT